eukprot:gene8663-13078_t
MGCGASKVTVDGFTISKDDPLFQSKHESLQRHHNIQMQAKALISDYSGCDGNNDDYGIEHHDTLSQLEMEVIKDHRADTHSPKSFTSITNVSAAVAERVLEKQRTSFNTKGEFNGEKNTIRSLDVLHHKHQRNPLHHAIHGQGSTLDIGHVEDSALFTNDAKKAVGYIELIEQEEVLSVDAMKRLRFVKEAIIGEDLYLTKITEFASSTHMDDEMKAYVNSALDLDPTVKQMSFRQKRSIKSIFNDVKKKITTHQASDNSAITGSRLSFHASELFCPIKEFLNDATRSYVLAHLDSWNMDVFHLAEISEHHPLTAVMWGCIEKLGLAETCKIDRDKLLKFIKVIEIGPHEMYSMLIAAAIHDFEHPGVNNSYLASVEHGLALRYNNISILEAHSYPFTGFSTEERQDARNLIIDAVLATDLAHHAKLLMEFKAAVNHPENTAPASPESQKAYHHSNDFKAACMKLAIKCADISNPARPWGLYSEWIPKVM